MSYKTFIEDSNNTMLDKMARRFALRIPGLGKKLSQKQLIWGAAGLLGVGALYMILKNQYNTGIPIIDQTLGQVGDITGLEGRGSSLFPQVFGSPAPTQMAPAGEPGYADWRFTSAYQGSVGDYPDEMRFSNVYKNE